MNTWNPSVNETGMNQLKETDCPLIARRKTYLRTQFAVDISSAVISV